MFRHFQRDFQFRRFEDKDSPRFRHFLLEFRPHSREFSKRNVEKVDDSRFSFDKLRFCLKIRPNSDDFLRDVRLSLELLELFVKMMENVRLNVQQDSTSFENDFRSFLIDFRFSKRKKTSIEKTTKRKSTNSKIFVRNHRIDRIRNERFRFVFILTNRIEKLFVIGSKFFTMTNLFLNETRRKKKDEDREDSNVQKTNLKI